MSAIAPLLGEKAENDTDIVAMRRWGASRHCDARGGGGAERRRPQRDRRAPRPPTEATAPRERQASRSWRSLSIKTQQVTFFMTPAAGSCAAPVSTGHHGTGDAKPGVFAVIEKDKDHHSTMYDDAWMPKHAGASPGTGVALLRTLCLDEQDPRDRKWLPANRPGPVTKCLKSSDPLVLIAKLLQIGATSALGLGRREKLRRSICVVENSVLDFVNLKTKSACDHY